MSKNILITGGLGFIGYAYINKFRQYNYTIVENFNYYNEQFLKNLSSNIPVVDYLNLFELDKKFWRSINFIIHLGAISNTKCTDQSLLDEINISFTKKLVDKSNEFSIPIIIASSASVYGDTVSSCIENKTLELPKNLYASSKKEVDDYIRSNKFNNSIFSLRFFNVFSYYDSRKLEDKKYTNNQSSPHYKWTKDFELGKKEILLFEGSKDIFRDFISIDLVIDYIDKFVNKKVYNPIVDIFNIGTGTPISFLDVADTLARDRSNSFQIKYIPFPKELKNRYQYYTCADMSKTKEFLGL